MSDSGLKTLCEVFDGGNRRFRIPEYQRGYSWGKSQRDDLLSDINHVSRQDYRHFTGTVVAAPTTESGNIYDLVDGQQRITTITLLVSAILRRAKQLGMSALSGDDLSTIEHRFIEQGRGEGNLIYQLSVGKEQNSLFQELLVSGQLETKQNKTKSDSNLVAAAGEFSVQANQWDEAKLNATYKVISQKLGFILYMPEKRAEIGMMFEVINNRGKPLSELDKIKNYLIYFAEKNKTSSLRKIVQENWGGILRALNASNINGNNDENKFLRSCWTVFNNPSVRDKFGVYDQLKSLYPATKTENWKHLEKFVKFLTHAANTTEKLATQTGVDNADERRWLERINAHPGKASIRPLILALYATESNPLERIETLSLLEKLNFRFYVCGIAKRSDSGQGTLFTFANNLYHHRVDDTKGQAYSCQELNEDLKKFVDENANDRAFILNLTLDKDESGDYYDWQGLRFFLASYEQELLSRNKESRPLNVYMSRRDPQAPNNFYHREHIWASKDYSRFDDSSDRNINKRRLANFILLKETANISAGKKSIDEKIGPEDKVGHYFADAKHHPNTYMIRELKGWYDGAHKEIWGRWERRTPRFWLEVYTRFLDRREEALVNFALDRWRVDGIKLGVTRVEVNGLGPNNEIFTCFPKRVST